MFNVSRCKGTAFRNIHQIFIKIKKIYLKIKLPQKIIPKPPLSTPRQKNNIPKHPIFPPDFVANSEKKLYFCGEKNN
jgi:hypothetical protein